MFIKTFLTIAWRNILRNRRRSLITIFSIGFGLGAMFFLWSYIDGAHLQLKENFTGLFMGHLQIHARGFEKTKALTNVIENPASLESTLQRRPEIAAYAPRVRAFAFFRTPDNSASGLLVGVDALREPRVSKIGSTVRTGRFLESGETGGVVLGVLLAENMRLALGNKVEVMAQGAGGTVSPIACRSRAASRTADQPNASDTSGRQSDREPFDQIAIFPLLEARSFRPMM